MSDLEPPYPFTALVGQERMKLALILNAIRPRIGGVLLRGERGTAKSTAARSIASLLPLGVPFRTLPLGATEDRVTGGLDLEASLAQGSPTFAPGLLHAVDEGVLYVDEVNLLDDHLVDCVLDAAASGVNRVEREGVSVEHPSRFTLIGSMNPEEGSLRPQFLDRFGFCVDVRAEEDAVLRVELLKRHREFDADPSAFARRWEDDERALRRRVGHARSLVSETTVDPGILNTITELSAAAHVAGHRADLVMAEAARAHAAWQGRTAVQVADVVAVAELALTHRRRDAIPPPDQPSSPPDGDQRGADQEEAPGSPPQDPPEAPTSPESSTPENGDDRSGVFGPDGSADPEVEMQDGPPTSPVETLPSPPPEEPFRVRSLAPHEDRLARRGSGRRSRTRSADRRGRYVRSRVAREARDLAVDATLRAAAPHQRRRRARWAQQHGGPAPRVLIDSQDWRAKIRERKVGMCVLFVVDGSGSMGARGRMAATKGAVLSLLLDAYQKRDKVALIAFRRTGAEVLLPPTASVDLANRLLAELPVGGRTPLASGIVAAHEMLQRLLRREPLLRPLVVLLSDGRANAPLQEDATANPLASALHVAQVAGADERVRWVVVDTEDPTGLRLGLAQRIASSLGAPCYTINELRADDLVGLVKGHTQ